MNDRIVEELRQVRKGIEAECLRGGEDYSVHILNLQKKYSQRLVQGSARKSLREKIA